MTQLSPDLIEQIDALSLDPEKPLIISDADEVLLKFIQRLEYFLDQRDMWFDMQSFQITGNIKSRMTNEPVDIAISDLLDEFFTHETRHIDAVSGAADALAALAKRAQIIVLTNSALHAKQARIDNLTHHGMNYPVIVGNGPKGLPVKTITAAMRAPIFFLDDIPYHIDSVAKHAPHTRRIHFVADPRLAKHIPMAQNATQRIDQWDKAYDWITAQLDADGF